MLPPALRERSELQPLRNAVNRVVVRWRREKKRTRKEYFYWRKHELAWVIVLLALSRKDARSRVLRELAEVHVRDLRAHLPGRR
jgi:hypothetical protein